MQRVEVTDSRELEIHCPFCGHVAITPDGLSRCEHTLFQALDEGFEYVSEKMGFSTDVNLDDSSIDQFTDELEYPNSIKFAVYQPGPSCFGGYVAFSNK